MQQTFCQTFELDCLSSEDQKNAFCYWFHKHGYALLLINQDFRVEYTKTLHNSKNFFNNATIEEKKAVCCEYMAPDRPNRRDRLEVRLDKTKERVICATNRNQFSQGYENSNENSHNIINYYFKENLTNFHKKMQSIGEHVFFTLLKYISYPFENLKLSFDKETISSSVLRVIRYGVYESDSDLELAQDHTDLGMITLIPASECKSLQLLLDHKWVSPEFGTCADDGLVVLIAGEQLAYASNYYYIPARHRVINTSYNRFSFPFLIRCAPNYIINQAIIPKKRLFSTREKLALKYLPKNTNSLEASKILNQIYETTETKMHLLNVASELCSTLENMCQSYSSTLITTNIKSPTLLLICKKLPDIKKISNATTLPSTKFDLEKLESIKVKCANIQVSEIEFACIFLKLKKKFSYNDIPKGLCIDVAESHVLFGYATLHYLFNVMKTRLLVRNDNNH